MKRKGIVFLSVAILISACTSYIDDNQNSIKPDVRVLGISATDSLLTPSDASVVALIERGGQILTKGVITEEVEEVIPIHDEEGNIIMYAVNYSNGGYVIVSATKDYYPVLARVEKGKYSKDLYNTGASVLMREYEEGIKYARNLPKDTLAPIRAMWKKYEEPYHGKRVAAKSDDPLLNLVDASIREWNEAGISYTFLNEGPPKDMPDDVYQKYVDYAVTFSNPNYDYYNNCVIIGERTDNRYKREKLMTTAWHQNYPFNSSIPNNYPVGCGGVATAQIMAYHKSPFLWEWDNILSYGDKLGPFIYEVANGIKTKFGPDESPSRIKDVRDYLDNKGYNVQHVSHDINKVIKSIDNSRPVFMTGYPKGENKGHAWVCDGYEHSSYYIKYTLLVISYIHTEPLQYEPCGESYMSYGPVYNFFHMNWGWGGYQDGYFSESGWPSRRNYSTNREDLVNIYPKQN